MVVGLAHKPAVAGRWTTRFAPQFVPLLPFSSTCCADPFLPNVVPEADLRALHEEAVHLGLRQVGRDPLV
eukprot:6962113-Pyramimonas_sp.AAC.1